MHWPAQKPYASVIAFCLHDNHFHLLLKETSEGGISKFMQRLSTSMAAYLNAKYGERGTPFQGSYRSRTVDNDTYLQYLNAYILVKNTFEIYPRGAKQAARSFDTAFAWAEAYPFSSLTDYMGHRHAEFLDYAEIAEVFGDHDSFKALARDVIQGRLERELDFLGKLLT